MKACETEIENRTHRSNDTIAGFIAEEGLKSITTTTAAAIIRKAAVAI